MYNIDDLVEGTAQIYLPRSVFKDQTYYDNLLSFLGAKQDASKIIITVEKGSYEVE